MKRKYFHIIARIFHYIFIFYSTTFLIFSYNDFFHTFARVVECEIYYYTKVCTFAPSEEYFIIVFINFFLFHFIFFLYFFSFLPCLLHSFLFHAKQRAFVMRKFFGMIVSTLFYNYPNYDY